MKKYLSIILFILTFNFTNAQIKTEKVSPKQIPQKVEMKKPMVFNLQPHNKDEIILQLEENLLKGSDDKFSFGKFFEFSVDFAEIESICKDDYCYKQIEIYSEGSNTLGVVFSTFLLSDKAKFYIINDEEFYLQGPLTKQTIKRTSNLISGLMPGEKLRFLLIEPITEMNESNIKISEFSHGIFDFYNVNNHNFITPQGSCNGVGCSASCNENIICHSSHETESLGVIRFVRKFNEEYEAIGTGSLINNGRQNHDPLVLTAAHVGGGTDYFQDTQFWFHYRSPTCNPTTNGPTNIFVQGAELLNGSLSTDLKLLRLSINPIEEAAFDNHPVSYLGWSILDEYIPSVTSIHHPLGDVQKFLAGTTPTFYTESIGGYFYYFWATSSTNGITQIYSSGSPLFDHNKRVIGANKGRKPGPELTCNLNENVEITYGRLDKTWNVLKPFLDPDNEGIVALNTITNQPGPKIISEISGPELMCSTESYSLINLPLDATINWNVNPSGLASISGSGSTITLNPISNGYMTLTANVNGKSFTKPIQIGPYQNSQISIEPFESSPYFCPNQTHSLYFQPLDPNQQNQYEIQVTNGTYTQVSHGYYWIHFGPAPSGPYVSASVSGRVNNGCGWSSWKTVNLYTEPSCSGGGCDLCFTSYPNPADDELNITWNEQENFSKNLEFSTYDLTLYNDRGEEILKKTVNEKKITLDTKNLKTGFYYIHIIHKDGIIRKKILIER